MRVVSSKCQSRRKRRRVRKWINLIGVDERKGKEEEDEDRQESSSKEVVVNCTENENERAGSTAKEQLV